MMRLVEFSLAGRRGLGSLVGNRVLDLTATEPRLDSTRTLLRRWREWGPQLPGIASAAPGHALAEVALEVPLVPRRLFAVGANYASHLAEMGVPVPAVPGVTLKPPGTVCATGSAVALPEDSQAIDYEGEIAVVIGCEADAVDAARAAGCIAGLTLANDVSARDLPVAQTAIAKASPGFCPLGPALVTLDELDISSVGFDVFLNGELCQSGRAAEMVRNIPELVSCLSGSIPLLPGDVVLSGTPAGVGIGRSPPRLLRPGDLVEVNSPALGVLQTRFVAQGRNSGPGRGRQARGSGRSLKPALGEPA